MHDGAELIFQRSRALKGAVRQIYALDPAFEQPEHHRAGRTAGAQYQRVIDPVPARRGRIEMVDEAFDVGIGRAQFARFVPQRIGGADGAGPRIRHCQRQRALLVRDGDVGADKAVGRQMQHEFGKAFRRHRLDIVAALNAKRPQPVVMDQRRTRMRRRPSDQACGVGFSYGSHHLPCRRTHLVTYSHQASRFPSQYSRRARSACKSVQYCGADQAWGGTIESDETGALAPIVKRAAIAEARAARQTR